MYSVSVDDVRCLENSAGSMVANRASASASSSSSSVPTGRGDERERAEETHNSGGREQSRAVRLVVMAHGSAFSFLFFKRFESLKVDHAHVNSVEFASSKSPSIELCIGQWGEISQ
jgi:hypothetical protein